MSSIQLEVDQFNWNTTPLGPRKYWPSSLEAIFSMMLASPLPMCATWGSEQTLLYNVAYAPILGMRHPIALGQPISEVWSDVWKDIGPLLKRVLAGEAVSFVDMHLVMTRHGYDEDTWWSFTYTPISDKENVRGILNIASETTARVIAARERDAAEMEIRARHISLEQEIIARREAVSRFSALIEYLPVGVCLLDASGQSVLTNPVFRKFLPEYSFSLDSEKHWQGYDASNQLLTPDNYPSARAFRGELVTPGNEFLLTKENGRQVWISISAVPLADNADKQAGIILVLNDIDERKRLMIDLERQVAERSQDRNALWMLSSDIMLRCTFDGTITATNPAWHSMLGWHDYDLIGIKIFDLIHPEDLVPTIEAAKQSNNGISFQRFDNRYRHRDGSYRWISWSTHPSENIMNSVGRDITRDKEQTAELEGMQNALRQSQKMEAVGQLTGGLAHDFNNLLAGISGALQLMQIRMQQGRFDDFERHIAMAQGASKRAAALTHRLLAFSRQQTLTPKATNVNRLIANMHELIQRTVGPTMPVEVVGISDAWTALVDESQLENALLNLCINARDAMPGGGRITIETSNKWIDDHTARKQLMEQGQYLSLCVTDNGTGMSKEVAARAFDPFFTTKPIGQGTGLGLSMIYGFAKQSGGQVRIYSEIGQGTTVCIYLPRHYGSSAEDEAISQVNIVARSKKLATVLIVDDEPTVRILLIEILEDLGYAWIEAEDSAAGMKILRSDERIDLLISDVGLPGGMNGRQMADAGRVCRPNLKVLFITGYAENAVLNNGYLEPGMTVITKPFSIELISARIQSMIDN